MATTNDLKNGTVLKIDGQLWTVIDFQHVKPGKGGAFVRTKLKSVLSGKVVDKTFNAGLKIETANVDKRDMQYLYKDGADYVFMDTSTFDQIMVSEATVGDATRFLLENQNVLIATHDGAPLYVELPPSVILEITYTEPGLQGDRVDLALLGLEEDVQRSFARLGASAHVSRSRGRGSRCRACPP